MTKPSTRRQPDYSNGLPADIHAESIVLGCILAGQLPLDAVLGDDFQDLRHRTILQQIGELQKASRPIDAATVALELDRCKKLQAAGGAAYISELRDLPEIIHPEQYVARIQQKALRRIIILQSDAQAKRALLDTEGIDNLITSGVDFYRELHTKNGHPAEAASSIPAWPELLRKDAYHGVAGELVRLIEPHSESDPAALLLQFLIGFGNLTGRGPYMQAEADRHHPNEYVVLVGVSSVGRKGSAWGRIASILESVDEEWLESRLLYGIGSGERLIDMAAETDHRVLIHEGEFARLLGIINREGSTISSNIRLAWDKGILEINSRQKTAKAKGAHISMIGHITKDELSKKLSDIEVTNGFGNRILWVCARRSRSLPHGSDIKGDAGPILRQLNEATRHARQLGNTRLLWDSEAHDLWSEVYESLAAGQPGLLGSATSRAAPHVLRLSLIYALLDCAAQVRAEHLRAALEVWRYCYDSARFIWGAALGDPTADQALKLIRGAGTNGMTRWDLSRAFSGHKSADELDRAVAVLTERGLIQSVETQTEGRSETRHFAS